MVRVALIIFVALLLLPIALADVGDEYCKQESPFLQKCVKQVKEDVDIPCKLLSYDQIYCAQPGPLAKASYESRLTKEQKKSYDDFGILTNMERRTETDVIEREEDGKLINVSVPRNIRVNPNVNTIIDANYDGLRSVTIGWATNEFNISTFANGTCEGCSIDVDVELANSHANTSRSNLTAEWLFTIGAEDTAGSGTLNISVIGATHRHERYEFDGVNDVINVSNASSMNFGFGNFTILAWVKGGTSSQGIVIKDAWNGVGGLFSGVFIFIPVNGANYSYWNGVATAGIGKICPTSWCQVAVVRTGTGAGQMKLYYNGVLTDNFYSYALNLNNSLSLTIGNSYDGGKSFNGSIDEVRVWNRSLSAAEINDTFQNELYKFANESSRTATYTADVVNITNGARATWTNLSFTITNRTAITADVRFSEDNISWTGWQNCTFYKVNSCEVSPYSSAYIQWKMYFGTDNKSYTPILSNSTVSYNSCVETWQATGWVKNGSLEYRNVNDTSSCGSAYFKPESSRARNEWVIAAFIIISAACLILYKASVELDPQHWPLKVGFFHASLLLATAGLALAVAVADANNASAALKDGVTIIYRAVVITFLLSIGYLMFQMMRWYFNKGMELGGMKIEEQNDKGW